MLSSSVSAVVRNAVIAFALMLAAGAWHGASVARAQSAPGQGPGGPILVVVDPSDPFGRYYAEILRAEGLNEFAVADVSTVTPASLAGADAVVLAKVALSPSQVAMFTNYVGAGGNLIAMRPDKQLAPLLGLADTGATLANGYMRIDTSGPPGAGVTGATMQYHNTADRYALAGATAVATLYSDAATATANPAVTLRNVGTTGGQSASFSYDLARSVVETRQGDPARAGQELDGLAPIRSDDLFFPDWLDFNKVAIPQADEQQRLLANLVTDMTLDRKPLPRFWYLPRGEKAAVVMSGDDHANGGTSGQFDHFMAESSPGCSVADWQCVRATSYVYTGTPLTDAQTAAYQAAGFEIALHYHVSGPADCNNFESATIGADLGAQLEAFAARWPSLAAPVTNRTHCIVFSDWSTEPSAERAHGIRLDANYYYWPGKWVGDRPGLFTGSGFPMRFAASNGALIDVYQLATQLTDESDMNIPAHIRALIDGALGADGYYGVFTANMHTDTPTHPGADAIVAEAQRRGVPVVSAAQMLTWLDGRNDSSFGGLSFTAGQLRFHLNAAPGSRGLQAMIPTVSSGGALEGLSRDGRAVPLDHRTVKGISYVVFDAVPGDYVASYPAVATGAGTGATAGSVPRRRPKVSVKLLSKRVSKRGTIAFRVTCPAAGIRCKVGIVLKRGRARAARTTVTVRGNTSKRVTLRLTKATRRRLARARRLTLKGRITASYGDGSRSTETLRITVRRR
jgi:hypothetical protein